jgi:hypothetical protein
MYSIRNSLGTLSLAALIAVTASGCKSSKKAREAAAEKARQEQEAAQKKQQDDDRRKQAAADEQARLDAEAKRKQQQPPEATPYDKVNQYFNAIANSSDVSSANSNIAEALNLFASPDAPVLIVISGSGDQKDYDKPTTIKSYLNYLKDQKKNINRVENLEIDSSGKITSVELRKN